MANIKMEKVHTTSENIENENINKLRAVFPEFVKDGVVDFDALQAFLKAEGALSGEEKYGLSWAGKSNAFGAIKAPSTGTLEPQKSESINWDTTENIFIEGDNLEVLKLLQKKYRGAIKMIYIDPPYNTGKDFIYKDNYTKNVSDYYEQSGQAKNGIKMVANTEKNGRYHSDWLTMMYPRLFLAQNLLKDDGVIFVSIDDNEVHNLRMIMDEIFGEENFVGQFVWKTRQASGKQVALNNVSIEHEYVISYFRNSTSKLEGLNRDRSSYTNPDNDPRGDWAKHPLDVGSTKIERPNCFYTITDPATGNIYDASPNRVWAFAPSSMTKLISEGKVIFDPYGKNRPALKKFWTDLKSDKKPISTWLSKENHIIDYNSEGTREVSELFNDKRYFDYPKPVSLLKFIFKQGLETSDIVLDFFAGSGTTAHAVMDLNAEDEGSRKWICVQLPEETDEKSEAYKAGYKTIADIARERIRRAGKKIDRGDIGFKSFKLQQSSYRQWNNLTEDDTAEVLKKQIKLFTERPLIDAFNEQSVVYEILLKEGFNLNAKIERVASGGMQLWKVSDEARHLFITFEKKITQESVNTLLLSETDTFVCFDNALDDTTKVNLMRNIKMKVI